MASLKDRSVSFIVRIWREPTEGEPDPTEWRGSIEEVESGDRTYFIDFASMLRFIKTRIAHVGIDVGTARRE
jgi:hypothetical protein